METYNITTVEVNSTFFKSPFFQILITPAAVIAFSQNGKKVAALSPNSQGFLDICQNPACINDEVLDKLSEAIELRHPEHLLDE